MSCYTTPGAKISTNLLFQDFDKQKQEGDDRVKDVVSSGRELVNEGVIPSEKREKFEIDLENIPGNWDDVVNEADQFKDK